MVRLSQALLRRLLGLPDALASAIDEVPGTVASGHLCEASITVYPRRSLGHALEQVT